MNELQALARQLGDAFDQCDVELVTEMLSEHVEVFGHVHYRFDGKPLLAKDVDEAVAGSV